MKKTLLASSISAIALSSALNVQAESLDEFVKGGSVDFNFRYRVESADVEGGADAALANTLKSRVTVATGSYYGLSVLVEGDNVIQVTDDFFDGGENGNASTDYDLVLDQETTQLNQAYLQYAMEGTTIKAGNQRINLDNQRHVGGVAFRQDEATFDAVSVETKAIANTTVFAAFANNLNNIKNDNVEADFTLVNVKYDVTKDLATTVFYYGIDDDGATLDTFGLRATGSAAGFGFEAEIATQDNETNDTLYLHLAGSKKLGDVKATLGYEVMGSDNGEASFNTPLGTNHKFLGWTDAYLSAAQWGTNGIQDVYATAVTNVAGVKLVGQLHKFSADEGSADLGTEVGIMAAKNFSNYGVSFKLAQLTGSDTKADTTKLWLTGTAKF